MLVSFFKDFNSASLWAGLMKTANYLKVVHDERLAEFSTEELRARVLEQRGLEA